MDRVPPPSSPATSKKPDKAFSCVRCFDRKVKCSKQIPCTSCTKAGVECVFRQPAPPRRRKKRTQEDLLLARLRRCEDILRSHGISPESSRGHASDAIYASEGAEYEKSLGTGEPPWHYSDPVKETRGTPAGPKRAHVKDPGRLVGEQGRMKFFENSLYSGLNEEIQANDDILEPSSADESETVRGFANAQHSVDFMLGVSPTSAPLISLHPPPEQIYKLWQVFLDNVNPLTKIIHQPTLQSAIFDASFNLDKLQKGLEALLFAIYASATYSLTDKECMELLYEEKTNLLARYRLGLRKALVRANFLATSELPVLQAFTIYLLSMRLLYDARTMWILAGVASRLGQSLGLHRDGTTLGLPPFDTEMRRRLWWQIVILDSRSAELSGCKRDYELRGWEIQVPAYVNDTDLWPQMTEAPISATGRATEMISCCLRYELGEFVRKSKVLTINGFDGDWADSNPHVTTVEKDKVIDELENLLQDKFIRYCDPSVPIHFHALIVSRAAIYSMRMMAHHPRQRSDKERVQSKDELDMVFAWALKIVECDNICLSSPVFQRFLWHSHAYFAWQALIYLLGALRIRTEGPDVDAAWQQIEQVYVHHPVFLTDTKRPLHVATGSLCLKAWNAREVALAEHGKAPFPPTTPRFIQTLRQERSRSADASTNAQPPVAENTNATFASNDQIPGGLNPVAANGDANVGANGDFDNIMLADFSMEDVSPMNWDDWDNLVNGYETSQFDDWTNLNGFSS